MSTPVFMLVVIAGILFYFIPALIGTGKRNGTAIFWLNLLLGWSVIGWVVAFVWATTKDEPPQLTTPTPLPSTDYEARAAQLRTLRDKEFITQKEFMDQLSRL